MSIASFLRDRLLRARQSEYVRDSAVNTVGLLVAALFPIAVTPLLSRIYSPEEFGSYGLFVAVTSTIAVIGGGKYEVAIVIPDTRREALETAIVASLVSVGICMVVAIGVLVGGASVSTATGLPLATIALAPLAVLVAVQFGILLNCSIRERQFLQNSIARGLVAFTSGSLMLGIGLSGGGAVGLIVGHILGQTIGVLALAYFVRRKYLEDFPSVSWAGIREKAQRFSDYPRFAVVSDFANTLALRMPVLVFSVFFGAAAVGYLTMFQRIWGGSSILGSGIGETFRQKAARDYGELGNFVRTYLSTFWLMAGLAIVIWLALVLLGPWMFAVVLGEEWVEAGVYAQILATLVCIQFVASPLGWSVYIVGRLRYNMVWQWALLAVYTLAFALGVMLGAERGALMLYAAAGSVMYLIYLVISYRMAQGNLQARHVEGDGGD